MNVNIVPKLWWSTKHYSHNNWNSIVIFRSDSLYHYHWREEKQVTWFLSSDLSHSFTLIFSRVWKVLQTFVTSQTLSCWITASFLTFLLCSFIFCKMDPSSLLFSHLKVRLFLADYESLDFEFFWVIGTTFFFWFFLWFVFLGISSGCRPVLPASGT